MLSIKLLAALLIAAMSTAIIAGGWRNIDNTAYGMMIAASVRL